jgi:hypothetical protein
MKKETSPKQGRPPGETGAAMDAIVKVRCDLAEKGHWVSKARKAGMTLSEWIRTLANKA